jgi:hypothetical protein
MPGRTDRPGSPPPADQPGQAGAQDRALGKTPDGSQDELRRRLASLPANHPSSPWYRERVARRERAARPDPAGEGQGEAGETRPDGAGRGRARDARPEGKAQPDTGEAATIAGRAARAASGAEARGPEKDSRRREDDALWRLAASQHAAAEGRRQAHRGGTPISPGNKGDTYRPWFADGSGDESWLSAEETADPWFTEGRGR